jgi:hypothetical protein
MCLEHKEGECTHREDQHVDEPDKGHGASDRDVEGAEIVDRVSHGARYDLRGF